MLRTALEKWWELGWLAHLEPGKLRSFLIRPWRGRLDVLIGLFHLEFPGSFEKSVTIMKNNNKKNAEQQGIQ